MSGALAGLLVGILFGTGILLVAHGWRRTQPAPPLLAALHKVPAYAPTAPESAANPFGPLLEQVARLIGGRPAIQRRLRLAGDPRSPSAFLVQQIALSSAVAAAALLLLMVSGGATRVVPTIAVTVLALVGGVLLGDYRLGRRATRRREAMAQQFPVAAQLLALLVAAGAPPQEAVGRVGAVVGGPLGDQFSAAAARSAAGQGFASSMRLLAQGTDLPVIERFVHGLLSAVERGSPLSEIIRAQALDAASESHRALMVSAGQRDVFMLVPVVFAVLPTVVLVCLLPGAVQLGLV